MPDRRSLILRVAIAYVLAFGLLVLVIRVVAGPAAGSVLVVELTAGILGLLAVVWMGVRMARAIGELTVIAETAGAGDREVPWRRSSVAELDRLGRAIREMATELGRRAQVAEEGRRTLEVILRNFPEGVVVVEQDDGVSHVNPVAARLLGGSPSQLSALSPHRLQRLTRAVRTAGEPAEEQMEHGTPGRLLRVTATPFDGRVLLVIADVTERHRVEQMRRDFVADASHELKTPVASILASVEALMIALDRDPDRAGDFAVQIEGSARQLARIVDDLLDLSRLESSEVLRQVVWFDRVVAGEVERIRPKAEEAGIRMVTDLRPVRVIGSEADLALAVRNLCDNAVRYTDPGGKVTVGLWDSGDKAVLEVRDTGVGIPRRALSRVFERFYRVDPARSRATGGTGLGLAIVKHVAERHGGRVTVDSELGVGSVFRLELPAGSVEEGGEGR